MGRKLGNLGKALLVISELICLYVFIRWYHRTGEDEALAAVIGAVGVLAASLWAMFFPEHQPSSQTLPPADNPSTKNLTFLPTLPPYIIGRTDDPEKIHQLLLKEKRI